ncbi:16S rRNA (adenine(1518)-N(6)/adenine(1519)-N(6))-dimethyltransferase RsmA [Xanthovirga aplysinae]|uniref:16S rRNA (adenine(1518)-N(6)/adenine(1519)-N(6))- dimethyltransferase RsmA n=1 Tax=Xanthovirga aplysinae TaxID=2529853 RepID=UPI0012BC3D7C|nr:16S rRNA (adenine(1518)-N(6)/adenine(1519)-N(6))-dimethyltransferase RsmA [Xanthovirga aplysinae]MTI33596.1 16S rRNA (adenine(1518)-N(6)/adenine(1519)-N(6))-dimethyltransferase RsmA [Xanthovirga aplysinae]
MSKVRPKKHLGQHFLTDRNIAERIVESLSGHKGYEEVLEIGPGMGVLTDFLINKEEYRTSLIDIDSESVAYLKTHYKDLKGRIIEGDFLRLDPKTLFDKDFAVIGNFPYNISSQIFFKILEHRQTIPEVVCMLQKEVAERIASKEGNKIYGILSVLLQAFYDIDYLFTVGREVFNPPPKVESAVIRLRRNQVNKLDCDEALFKRVVKQGFNNRRKTLRNALKPLDLPDVIKKMDLLNKRAEQLTVDDFVFLTKAIADHKN